MDNKPTWKNTLYSGHARHSLDEFAATARALGYSYIEWNGSILSVDNVNPDAPVARASELS